jgi:hypothetical protein
LRIGQLNDAATLGRQNSRSADVRVPANASRFFSESLSNGKLNLPAILSDFNRFAKTFVMSKQPFWVAGSLLAKGSLGRLPAQD